MYSLSFDVAHLLVGSLVLVSFMHSFGSLCAPDPQ